MPLQGKRLPERGIVVYYSAEFFRIHGPLHPIL